MVEFWSLPNRTPAFKHFKMNQSCPRPTRQCRECWLENKAHVTGIPTPSQLHFWPWERFECLPSCCYFCLTRRVSLEWSIKILMILWSYVMKHNWVQEICSFYMRKRRSPGCRRSKSQGVTGLAWMIPVFDKPLTKDQVFHTLIWEVEVVQEWD